MTQELTPEQQEAIALLNSLAAGGAAAAAPQGEVLGGFWGGDTRRLGGPGGVPYRPGMAPVVYHEGDEFSHLRNMSTEELARFQDTLVTTGLVREVIPGRLDDSTAGAMQMLMSVANRQAVKWQDVLDGIVSAGGLASAQEEAREFEPGPYLAPDYASLAQTVKDTFRQRLGRDPDEGEMAQLVGELQGWDRQRYGAEVAADRMAFEQGEEPGEQGGGTVQGVDPLARFREAFESNYREELDFVEDKAGAAEDEAFMQGTAQTISQAARSRF